MNGSHDPLHGGGDGSPEAASSQALTREVLKPSSDRGRLAALATICSLAGVALGFALAGTMFASIPVAARASHGYTVCGHRTTATPAWIGIGVRSDGPEPGAWVRVIRPHSPAVMAGLRSGDVITGLDGVIIDTADELVDEVRARRPGTRVELTLTRNGEARHQAVVLEPMPLDVWRVEQAR